MALRRSGYLGAGNTGRSLVQPLYTGNGSPVRLMDFIAAIEQELGREAIKDMLPMQPGDVEQTWADTSGLERDFGYRPTTGITQGVQQFIRWYREYYGS